MKLSFIHITAEPSLFFLNALRIHYLQITFIYIQQNIQVHESIYQYVGFICVAPHMTVVVRQDPQ